MESDDVGQPVRVNSSHKIPIRITSITRRTSYYSDYLGSILRRHGENLIWRRAKKFTKKRRQRVAVMLIATLLVISTISMTVMIQNDKTVVSAESRLTQPVADGWSAIQSAKTELESEHFSQAANNFQVADHDFSNAYASLEMSGQVSSIMPLLSFNNQTMSTVQALLSSAHYLCQAGIELSNLAGSWSNSVQAITKVNSSDQFAGIDTVIGQLLANNKIDLHDVSVIQNNVNQANRLMTDYASQQVGNRELESAREKVWSLLPTASAIVSRLSDTLNLLPLLVGQNQEQHYLIEFLNNTELRPGGGFIGSYATLSLKNGSVNGFAVQTNIYKIDNTFTKVDQITPPDPIAKITPDWAMRDSNWSVNFPDAAAKTAWFFQAEGGGHLDGVIAIDTTFITDLLRITGPIQIPDQNMTVSADNFVSSVQNQVEINYWDQSSSQANEPKSILANFFPLMLQKIFQAIKQHPQKVLSDIGQSVAEKHLLISFLSPAASSLNNQLGLDGALPKNGDFLEVSNANLGGLKSSLEIKQSVSITLSTTNHNTIRHSVIITRQHLGTNIWPDGNNDNYLRLAVPKDAILDSASSTGNEPGIAMNLPSVESFSDYQTFGLWLTTPVQQTRSAAFVYETPINQPVVGDYLYQFRWVKQPGWLSDHLSVQFKSGDGWQFLDHGSDYNNPNVATDQWWSIPIRNQHWLL